MHNLLLVQTLEPLAHLDEVGPDDALVHVLAFFAVAFYFGRQVAAAAHLHDDPQFPVSSSQESVIKPDDVRVLDRR